MGGPRLPGAAFLITIAQITVLAKLCPDQREKTQAELLIV
jgi:hypothetical protein